MAHNRSSRISSPSLSASSAQSPRRSAAVFQRRRQERHKPCRVPGVMRKLLLSAALAVATSPALVAAQSADAIIDRAVAAYARLNSMRAEFRQTLTNPLTGNSQTTSGVILRQKPNQIGRASCRERGEEAGGVV